MQGEGGGETSKNAGREFSIERKKTGLEGGGRG